MGLQFFNYISSFPYTNQLNFIQIDFGYFKISYTRLQLFNQIKLYLHPGNEKHNGAVGDGSDKNKRGKIL